MVSLTLGTDKQTAIKFRENKADILLSHTPGLDVKGDDEMIFGSTKLQKGREQPQESSTLRKATYCC